MTDDRMCIVVELLNACFSEAAQNGADGDRGFSHLGCREKQAWRNVIVVPPNDAWTVPSGRCAFMAGTRAPDPALSGCHRAQHDAIHLKWNTDEDA
jgi:hypothetical protein